jgi:hypothetical protein
VLDDLDGPTSIDPTVALALGVVVDRIRAILDSAPPAPRATGVASESAVSLERAPDGASKVGESHFRATSVEADTDHGLWYVHVLDEPVHHTTEGVPVNVDWTRDGTLIGVELLGPGNLKPAPRVFLPHDRVPVGTVITSKGGSPFRVPDTYATDGLAAVGLPFVEVCVPSPEEWQAAVDRARDARAVEAAPPTKAARRDRKTPGGFPYRQHPHDLSGSNVERQQVGDPGHCEDCCSVGHVVAHPDLGCGDVGCYRSHGDEIAREVSSDGE